MHRRQFEKSVNERGQPCNLALGVPCRISRQGSLIPYLNANKSEEGIMNYSTLIMMIKAIFLKC